MIKLSITYLSTLNLFRFNIFLLIITKNVDITNYELIKN